MAIDGLFGIGLKRSPSGDIRAAIEAANRLPCPMLAIDVPSGLDADTGALAGDDGVAVRATRTLTFIADKPGLHTCEGRDHAGAVRLHALGIEPSLFPSPRLFLNEPSLFSTALPARRHNSHKGSNGDLAVVGGAHGMSGAVILAARTASRCGAGRVFAAFESQPPAFDHGAPELMCRAAADIDFAEMTTVIGPGLGTSEQAQTKVSACLAAGNPIVVDADALNLVASSDALRRQFAERAAPIVITPHPLEAARLLQTSAAAIQSDRAAAAWELARRFNAVVVLKGSGTVIARPDGLAAINPTGNPGLATAGTGDVLAGLCGALLAQHMPPWEAALAAVWLHGRAADALASEGIGPIGLTAGELIPAIRAELNRLAPHPWRQA